MIMPVIFFFIKKNESITVIQLESLVSSLLVYEYKMIVDVDDCRCACVSFEGSSALIGYVFEPQWSSGSI